MTASAIYTTRIPAPLQPVMEHIAQAAIQLAQIIRRGENGGAALGAEVGTNADGDGQKALDVTADALFLDAMRSAGLRWYASEEQDHAVELNPNGCLAVALDPLDGSSNIDTNVSIGTIFSIFKACESVDETFLRAAKDQLAGGYVIYGPRTCLVVTFGNGVQVYTLNDASGQFELSRDRIELPRESREFAINASNYRHWAQPVRAYIDDCLAGTEGPREANFNMRWIASLVAETHRILMRGGIFLYPSDRRSGYERGRLRMLYECAPIAFLIEQAGGRATDGCEPIMGNHASHLHERTPFIFGSADMVDRVATYHDLPETEVSALFGNRGLFRA